MKELTVEKSPMSVSDVVKPTQITDASKHMKELVQDRNLMSVPSVLKHLVVAIILT